ncbi:MAG: prolipoprotein diacylglyceryl transferase [Candidatus Omnitrophota bacterium]
MFPIIFQIGPFKIYSYGFMLVIAFLVAARLVSSEAKRQAVNPEIIYNFLFIVFICGILGSRIFFIIENIKYYWVNPLEIIMLQNGGLSWFGGFILGSTCGVIYLKKKKLSVIKTLDLVMPYVALAQAIGRIGCLLNGCCYGKISSFGVYFPAHKHFLIPTQIYSSLLLLLIFVVLRIMQEKKRPVGEIFFMYLFLYAIKRFFIEFWRADNPVILWSLTLFQILSIIMFVTAFLALMIIRIRVKKS